MSADTHVGTVAEAIVGGTPSDDSQNPTVLLLHYDQLQQGGGTTSGCSGVLLAPRLVLTARHCVSMTDEGAACNADGKSVSGGAVSGDYSASAIYVFGGKARPDFIGGNARPAIGQEILTTGADTLCNQDLAMVLLATPVEGATIAPIRLDGPAKKGEGVTIAGWGITDTTSSPNARQQRTGLSVLDVGPETTLGPAEFLLGEGPCSGDSGGPAFASTGAVIGTLSRGGNGLQPGAAGCVGSTVENVYSMAAGHADFIRSGYAKAGQEPWLEGGPNPLLGPLGATCTENAGCQSTLCNVQEKACTVSCADAACPSPYACVDRGAANGGKVCILASESTKPGSCTAALASPASDAVWPAIVTCALAVLFRTRRWRKT